MKFNDTEIDIIISLVTGVGKFHYKNTLIEYKLMKPTSQE